MRENPLGGANQEVQSRANRDDAAADEVSIGNGELPPSPATPPQNHPHATIEGATMKPDISLATDNSDIGSTVDHACGIKSYNAERTASHAT